MGTRDWTRQFLLWDAHHAPDQSGVDLPSDPEPSGRCRSSSAIASWRALSGTWGSKSTTPWRYRSKRRLEWPLSAKSGPGHLKANVVTLVNRRALEKSLRVYLPRMAWHRLDLQGGMLDVEAFAQHLHQFCPECI